MKIIRTSSAKVSIKRPRSPVSQHGYTERNKNLLALGFRSYGEYLKSEMWSTIRKLAFAENGAKCVVCGRAATQIHHSSYDLRTLVGSNLKCLHPVCSTCHESAEIVSGEKVHHATANESIGVSTPSPDAQACVRRQYERTAKEQARRADIRIQRRYGNRPLRKR
jgi:hypothetical protein